MSPEKSSLKFEDDFPFPKVGYVSTLEGIAYTMCKYSKLDICGVPKSSQLDWCSVGGGGSRF